MSFVRTLEGSDAVMPSPIKPLGVPSSTSSPKGSKKAGPTASTSKTDGGVATPASGEADLNSEVGNSSQVPTGVGNLIDDDEDMPAEDKDASKTRK